MEAVFAMQKTGGFRIDAGDRQRWGSIALVWAGSVISVPALMIGGILGDALPLWVCALGIVLGYLIVCAYMSLMGMQGCDTGLPTAVMTAGALGEKGAKYVISTILAVACIGWFGIQAGVCGTAFAQMLGQLTGFYLPTWLSCILWGIIMLVSACFRFSGLKQLNRIAVPVLLIVCLVALVSSLRSGGISKLQSHVPTQTLSIVDVISMTVGHFAVAGAIAGDYCRFAKRRSDVVKSSFVGVLPAGLIILMLGAVLFIMTGTSSFVDVLTASGLPIVGLIALALTSWTTNVANAYSGGLSLAVLLGQDEKKSQLTTAVAGILGTILASIGILSGLRTFLSLLTALVPPLVGPVIADYWLVRKGKVEKFAVRSGFHLPGMIAYLVGALAACVTGGTLANIPILSSLNCPFFIGPLNGIIVSAGLYLLLTLKRPSARKAAPTNPLQGGSAE